MWLEKKNSAAKLDDLKKFQNKSTLMNRITLCKNRLDQIKYIFMLITLITNIKGERLKDTKHSSFIGCNF